MANNIKVNWVQLTELQYSGEGLSSSKRTQLYNQTINKSRLDFGSVQAGKITPVRCVVANFSGAAQVSNLQFWLDSTSANASGSQNIELSTGGWEFYYCIVPKKDLKFDISGLTEAQKKGQTENGQSSYLDSENEYQMSKVPRSVETIPSNQFASLTDYSDENSLVITLNSSADSPDNDSHLILLDVQTPVDANSGNTEGWYYRMNFLYN